MAVEQQLLDGHGIDAAAEAIDVRSRTKHACVTCHIHFVVGRTSMCLCCMQQPLFGLLYGMHPTWSSTCCVLESTHMMLLQHACGAAVGRAHQCMRVLPFRLSACGQVDNQQRLVRSPTLVGREGLQPGVLQGWLKV